MYTLPGGLMQAVLLAEAAGVVVAAGGAAAAGSGVMRERRWPALWCAALLVLGAAMAIVYAGEADPSSSRGVVAGISVASGGGPFSSVPWRFPYPWWRAALLRPPSDSRC